MTPAERLAKAKRRKRAPRNAVQVRNVVWRCLLREKREAFQLTIRDVARELGMSVSGLFAIENGTDPMLTTARKLAEFYGMTTDELWPAKA